MLAGVRPAAGAWQRDGAGAPFRILVYNVMSLVQPLRALEIQRTLQYDMAFFSGTRLRRLEENRPYWVQRFGSRSLMIHAG